MSKRELERSRAVGHDVELSCVFFLLVGKQRNDGIELTSQDRWGSRRMDGLQRG